MQIVRLVLLLCAFPLAAIAQPVIDILSPGAGVCFGNGDVVFEGFPGGQAVPDPVDVPLVIEVGSGSGAPVHLEFRVADVLIFQDDFVPAQPNVAEETDIYVLPAFGVQDDENLELTVVATADNQESEDSVTFRLDREPPQMVIDIEALDALAGCHDNPPDLAFEVADAQDDDPSQAVEASVNGCAVTRAYTLTDDCGNAQVVNVTNAQPPPPNSVSVALVGYRCTLDECITEGDDAETFDGGARIGRGTVVFEIEEPNGCVDDIRATVTVDGGEPDILVPGQAYEVSGDYVASIAVGACGQEVDSDELRFEVLDRPTANAGGDRPADGEDPIVQGDDVVIDGRGSQAAEELGGIVEYAWDLNGDGFYDEEEGREAQANFDTSAAGDGPHRVWLRITAGNGGIDFDSAIINVTDVDPTCEIQPVAGGPFSEGDAVTFGVVAAPGDPADPISHYEWDFGDERNPQIAEGLDEATHIFEDSGEGENRYTVRVRVHDIDSFCEATVDVEISDCDPIIDGPGAFNDDALREGDPVRFNAGQTRPCNAFDGLDAFVWTFEEGAQAVAGPGLREPQHTYQDDGEKRVCLQVEDEDSAAQACFDIVVADLEPVPEFDGPNIVGEGVEACFDATNTVAGGPADPLDRFEWDFGDDSPVEVEDDVDERVRCHTFEGSGEFTVTLTAFDEDSSSVYARVIQVTDVAPTARGRAVLADDELATEGEPVRFDGSDSTPGAASDPIETYRWAFGDGVEEESDEPTTSHVYGDDGTYAVRLTVIDSDGSEQGDVFAVEVRNRAPRITVEMLNGDRNADGDLEIEIGREAELRVTVDDVEADLPPGRVAWDFGDGDGTGDNPDDAPRLTTRHRYGVIQRVTVSVEVDDYDGECIPIDQPAPDQCDGGAGEPPQCGCVDHRGDGDACLRLTRSVGEGEGARDVRVCRIVGSNDTAEVTFNVTPAAPVIGEANVQARCEGEPVDFEVTVSSAVAGQDAEGNDVYDGPVIIGTPIKPGNMDCVEDEGDEPARQKAVRCTWLPTFFDAGDHVVRITALGPERGVSRSRDVTVTVLECGQPLLAGVGGGGSRGLLRLFSYGRQGNNVEFRPTAEVVVGLGATSLAASPDGRYVYVASPGSGGVAVVNAINRPRVVRVIPTGSNPSAVVLGWVDGTPWLFAVNSGDDTLSAIDPDTMKVEHTVALGSVRGAYDLAWLAEVYEAGGQPCDGPADGCDLERPARLVVGSRRGGQVALVDPSAVLEGRGGTLAVRRFPGPIVRVAAEGRSGVIGAADGKSRAVHVFLADALEDDPGAVEVTSQSTVFIPRDMFVRGGVVHTITETSLIRTTPGRVGDAPCNAVRGFALAPLPDSMLPNGDFVIWNNGRAQNYTRGGNECGAGPSVGEASPTLRRLTTFVGME